MANRIDDILKMLAHDTKSDAEDLIVLKHLRDELGRLGLSITDLKLSITDLKLHSVHTPKTLNALESKIARLDGEIARLKGPAR